MKPYDVNTVADYMIQRLNVDEEMNLINLKLQKLLYYLQAWSLGIHKERFMNCTFEAWVHGPVCRTLYDRFKGDKSLYSFITSADVQNKNPQCCIEPEDLEFINFILDNYAGFSGTELEVMTHREKPWDNYAGFSGTELEVMTHREKPWQEARRGVAPLERCTKEISDASMRDFYGKKWEKISD